MATLVLTTVGGLIGGPIGGAIGAALGSRIDRRLLGPRRRGPRLGDLSVQTSSYGAALPKLFGTMRVAGTVIWATDLREDSHHGGGGKGGGAATTYSYSASFAVALSSRPIRSVRRIWADGKLLRGAAGDWKSALGGFRLHEGGDDQSIDPLIAAAEGLDAAPAHRGLAYGVFEGLELADFGNRIPSLTFEVEADEGAVPVGAIVSEMSDGAIGGDAGASVEGYAATGDSVRGAIEALAAAFPLSLSDDGAVLRIGVDAVTALPADALGTRSGDTRESRLVRDRRAAGALPDEIAVAYYEPARDFQAGLQRARRDGLALRGDRIELPAAIGADAAKGAAEAALARAWRRRDRASVRLPWRHLETRAGGRVSLAGETWRVAGWTFDRMAVELSLERDGPALAISAAMPGRATGGPDAPAGATVLHLLDLPGFDGGGASAPRVWLAAAGLGAGWRRATASLSLDGGASWDVIGMTAPAATMGTAATILGPGPKEMFDRGNGIEVDLLHPGMTLPGGGDAALAAGRNLALIGEELIVFGTATQIGAVRWRLSDLVRGRYGSDGAIGTHGSGERFVLIETGRMRPIDLPASAIGSTARVQALGPGDDGVAAMAGADVVSRALRPPAPVAITSRRLADGTWAIAWIRRSRIGWAWLDGTDAPLGESGERYRIVIAGGGSVRTVETSVPAYAYAPAEQMADGVTTGSAVSVTIAQLGTFGASLPPATYGFIA